MRPEKAFIGVPVCFSVVDAAGCSVPLRNWGRGGRRVGGWVGKRELEMPNFMGNYFFMIVSEKVTL